MTLKVSAMTSVSSLDGTELLSVSKLVGGVQTTQKTTAQAIADLAATSAGSPLPVNPQTGTTYTLALTDAPSPVYQGVVTMNNASANTLTVPPNSSVAFPIGTQVQVVQLGAGQTSVAAGAGVTVRNASSANARAQYSSLVLTQVAADLWVLGGDVA